LFESSLKDLRERVCAGDLREPPSIFASFSIMRIVFEWRRIVFEWSDGGFAPNSQYSPYPFD